jgi:predicted regulator of Ras-like GTPase activity (Roadblock/LC7/MglB family)
MIWPQGTDIGILKDPLHDESIRFILTFTGMIQMNEPDGTGGIISKNGRMIAAYFEGRDGVLRGRAAIDYMNRITSGIRGEGPELRLTRYNPEEFQEALSVGADGGMLLSEEDRVNITAMPSMLNEEKLKNILRQPGVIAVSAFFEGFSVQSFGNADFEQVAAIAEDLLRAGMKMIANMDIGRLEQMLLETDAGKFIIAPYGDLYLCLYTQPDANLGLLRLALHGLSQEVNDARLDPDRADA